MGRWRKQLSQPSFTNGFARSRSESVRPDLWPDHAWVPALGVQGGVLFDLCGTDNGIITGATWASTGLFFDGSTGAAANIADSESFTFTTSESFSLLAKFTPTNTGLTANQNIVRQDRQTQLPRSIICLRMASGKINFFCCGDTARMPAITGSTSLANNNTYVALGVRDVIDDKLKVFLNGSPDAMSVSDNTAETINGDWPFRIGAHYHAEAYTEKFAGIIHLVCLYRKAIYDQYLQIDPFLPFRRRVPVFYSMPSGGPTFNAAWARNSNVIIQPGVY